MRSSERSQTCPLALQYLKSPKLVLSLVLKAMEYLGCEWSERMKNSKAGQASGVTKEPMDIAARFYFEAEKAKIAKARVVNHYKAASGFRQLSFALFRSQTEVKELRQLRNIDEGLSTMEVEIEACPIVSESEKKAHDVELEMCVK